MLRVKIHFLCFICIRDVINKLEIRQAEVKLLVYKSERLSRHAKMEGKKLDEKRQKSWFLWKIWQLSIENETDFYITGSAAICLSMDGNTIIALFTSYYDVSETSQNASEVFQTSFFFWS